jgi:hypothetical protein
MIIENSLGQRRKISGIGTVAQLAWLELLHIRNYWLWFEAAPARTADIWGINLWS